MATLNYLKGVKRMDVLYDIKEETVFDSLAGMLKEMSEGEKQHFMVLIQGYRAGIREGIRVGIQIAGGQQEEPA